MTKQVKYYGKYIIAWFVVNSVVGLLISSVVLIYSPYSFKEIFFTFSLVVDPSSGIYSLWGTFLSIELSSHLISSFSGFVGYKIGNIHTHKTIPVSVLITLIPTNVMSFIMFTAICIAGCYMYDLDVTASLKYNYSLTLIPVLIITTIIGTYTTIVERLQLNYHNLKKRVTVPHDNAAEENIIIRENGEHFQIKQLDIIFLSSFGKKTIIHTEGKQFEISVLFKVIQDKLDKNLFLRVHKQFIINKKFIKKFEYYKGGRYLISLHDEDENTIPVGRQYAVHLKKVLK